MATAAPQAAMEMPQQGANPFADPNTMAVYDQLRQTTSPKQFGDEMLAGASQVDPQAVAEFLGELQSMEIPPEILDTLNDLVDQILANPERYPELRAQYMAQGLPEDILPEQFDPQFFAALNMAIDQMIAAPSGVQSFAQGGIAELKPIAKAIASYGRNGDTMLAHITPAEARMLRRRGGSGTINPTTGLPEFANIFQKIGRAVKKFANSTVGRIITTVALGFFLGPAAASFLGVGAGTAASAAISGFIGGAGSTLLAGGSLKDALKTGAVAGLSAGAFAGVTGSPLTGPSTVTPGEAFSGQVARFNNATGIAGSNVSLPGIDPATGAAPAPPPLSRAGFEANLDYSPGAAPVPPPLSRAGFEANLDYSPGADAAPVSRAGLEANLDYPSGAKASAVNSGGSTTSAPQPLQPGSYKVPTVTDSFSKMGEGLGMGDAPASYETFKQGATDLFSPGPTNAQLKLTPEYADAISKGKTITEALGQAAKANAPGMLRTYGPAAVAGLGTLAAFGGFDTKPAEPGDTTRSLRKPVTQRIAEAGTQRQMYMQGLPGVVYDQYGAPVYGQSTRLPTYDVPDYNSGGYRMSQGPAAISMPSTYIPQPGSIGASSVAQPYNTSDMYSNLVPRQYAEGGYAVAGYAEGGPITKLYQSVLKRTPSTGEIDYWNSVFGKAGEQTVIDERKIAAFTDAAAPELAAMKAAQVTKTAEQKTARDAVAQQKAMRRSQGSGQMYNNINAGLAALAPESDPRDSTSVEGLYRNILRREPDAGGLDFWKSKFGDTVDEKERAAFQGAAAPEIAARNNFRGEAPYQSSFGADNRKAGLAGLQTTYGPALKDQRDALTKQRTILANVQPTTAGTTTAGTTTAGTTTAGTTTAGTTTAGTTAKSVTAPPVVNPYSNITDPQAAQTGYTGPNLYSQVLAMGMPSRDAELPAYNYTPLPAGTTTRQPSTYSTGNTPASEAARRQAQNQRLLDQGATSSQIRSATETMFGPQITNTPAAKPAVLNMGGIAALTRGGYPRRTGQINGPGTEKSDSIPAMLSDGEFVMTAKAVRGAGKGSRRAGAKKMYALMHQLEKNSERG